MELLNILLLLSFTLLIVVIILFLLALFCYFPPSCPILLSMGLRRKNKNTVSQATNNEQLEISKSDSNGFYEIPLKGTDRANSTNEEQQSADLPEIVLTTASMKMRRL
ncbi:hypothetical protein Mgra_00005722 [Meloidogyne graminicola]|uniref:Uncharacterized protein n=1 Tax=Meloidogyne graminicola TaxID=189291 RepID=A0A8S9ZN25_9BILA|nr:hypothetical protein Mgra_00005722 [Meloidogyne graminicola]